MRFTLLVSSIASACAFEVTGLHSQLATVVDAHVSHAQTSTRLAELPALSSLRGHRSMNFMLRGSGLRVKQPDGDFDTDSDSDDGGFGGVIGGFLLWCFIPICLWNNERIAIKQYKMQYKAEKYALIIDDPDKEPLAGADGMEGRIVYVTGTAKVEGPALVDPAYKSVKSEGIVKLRRIIQMYQWVEHERKEKDRQGHERTIYSYSQSWQSSEQSVTGDNSKRNPPMKLKGTSRQKTGYRAAFDAMAGVGDLCPCVPHENFKLGQYYLGEYVIRELLNWKKKEVTEDMVRKGPLRAEKELTQDGDFWYLSGRPTTPQTGDMRIQFEELVPGPLTVVGVLTKTKTGWTFVPVLRADAAKAGDNVASEFGGKCCPCLFRVKELHYGLDEEGDAEVMRELPNRPVELKRTEMAAFKRSATTITADYEGGDIDDLCCVGCCGVQIVQLMHYLGLEEEFLAVSEENQELHQVMKDESSGAANRHHAARLAGLVGLCCASSCIISPIIALLNYNWLSSLLVGWWLGSLIMCCACVTSLVAFLAIVSAAWIAHRPWMAMTGILLASSLIAGSYMLINAQIASTTAAPAF